MMRDREEAWCRERRIGSLQTWAWGRGSRRSSRKNWIANAELARSFRATDSSSSTLCAECASQLRETAFPPLQLNWK